MVLPPLSFDQLRMAASNLKKQATKKNEGSLAYVKGGLSTFFEAQDALAGKIQYTNTTQRVCGAQYANTTQRVCGTHFTCVITPRDVNTVKTLNVKLLQG